jgi:hypothetical protein
MKLWGNDSRLSLTKEESVVIRPFIRENPWFFWKSPGNAGAGLWRT